MFVNYVTSENIEFGQQLKPNIKAWYSTAEAARIASVDQSTIIRWCQKYGTAFARRYVGRWGVSAEALAKILQGEELGDREKS